MNIFELAINPNTLPETLDRLSYNKDWDVRFHVAQNPNTQPETLDRLADDKSSFVRYCVTWNPKTPQYLKDYLKIKDYFECYEHH